jgi:uncharacterized protein
MVIQLTRDEARRIAVRAQGLSADRDTDVVTVIRRLNFLQIDPTAAIAPNADLVLWSRLGATYDPAQLTAAHEVSHDVFEYRATLRPTADLDLYRAAMDVAPRYLVTREWLAANDGFKRDVLARITAEGPLQSKQIPDTSQIPWPSTGWSNNRNVTQMLEILTGTGDLAIVGRVGRQRVWDLASRSYPPRETTYTLDEATAILNEHRLRALGIVSAKAPDSSVETGRVGGAGQEAMIEGVAGTWRVDPAALDRTFAGRTALLSPFDRLVHDRNRLAGLWDYEYLLEMYKPEAARRWGFFALPILHDDRLVGKVDARADRKAGQLVVRAIHEDEGFTRTARDGVQSELESLAAWLQLKLVTP